MGLTKLYNTGRHQIIRRQSDNSNIKIILKAISPRFQMEEEEAKRSLQRVENVRRRHNYLPFIMALLKAAAKEKLLVPLYQKAKDKGEANKKAKEERKKKLAAA